MGCCADALPAAKPLPPPASIRNAEKAACENGNRHGSEATAGSDRTCHCAPSAVLLSSWQSQQMDDVLSDNHTRHCILSTASATEEAERAQPAWLQVQPALTLSSNRNPAEFLVKLSSNPLPHPTTLHAADAVETYHAHLEQYLVRGTAAHPGEQHGQRQREGNAGEAKPQTLYQTLYQTLTLPATCREHDDGSPWQRARPVPARSGKGSTLGSGSGSGSRIR